jgi:signal transduction histidine kinase
MADIKELEKEHLDLLLQASSLLNSTLSLDGVLSYLLREAAKIVGAQNGMILLLDGDELVTKTSIPDNVQVSYSRTIVAQVLKDQRTVCLLDAAEETIDPLSSIKSGNLRSVICSPLLWRGEVRGVIYLDHRVSEGLFQEEQQRLIEALSQQWAVALQNAALHEEREVMHQTALQEATNELAETQAQLFTAQELTGVATQAFRDPLTEMTQSLKGLKARGARREVETVMHSLNKLARLVQLFGEFVQPDRSQWKTFALDEMMAKVVQSGLTREFELRADLKSAEVYGDEESIERVFLNLLRNSEEALVTAKGSPFVAVCCYNVDGRPVLEVEDTGCGMSAEVKKRMFEPFFSTKGIGSGSGLGLAIARQVLEVHRAEVQVASEPGQGTRVRVVFPTPPAAR